MIAHNAPSKPVFGNEPPPWSPLPPPLVSPGPPVLVPMSLPPVVVVAAPEVVVVPLSHASASSFGGMHGVSGNVVLVVLVLVLDVVLVDVLDVLVLDVLDVVDDGGDVLVVVQCSSCGRTSHDHAGALLAKPTMGASATTMVTKRRRTCPPHPNGWSKLWRGDTRGEGAATPHGAAS